MNFRERKSNLINRWISVIMIFAMVMGLFAGFSNSTQQVDAAVSAFEKSISGFPESYKTYLRALNKKYPNWKFVPYNTGIDFATAVAKESEGDRSLIENTFSEYLKSNAAGDYNASTGKYIAKDGGSWVTASANCVAYFMDPRNFLDEEHIFMFEQLAYDATTQNQTGVEAMLQGSFMYKTKIGYINTNGKYKSTDTLYSTEIMTAAKNSKVSAYYLAAKMLQEIGKSKSKYSGMGKHGSINGQYSTKYTGIYNFYNIGASTSAKPIEKGLNWASGGDDKETSYLRPWNTPMKSIEGGAKYIGEKYINCGQNTTYFQRFNVNKNSKYELYTHQYMTNIYGAANEGKYTYNAYDSLGLMAHTKTFVIPVYNNMPPETNTIVLGNSAIKTAKVNSNVNLRQGPSTEYSIVTTLQSGESVTVTDGVLTHAEFGSRWLSNPYWYKVTVTRSGKQYTGYLSASYISFDANMSVVKGVKTKLPVKTGTAEKIYYMSDNPAIATVDKDGNVIGVKDGTTTITAFTSSGRFSSMGIQVISKGCIVDITSMSLIVGEKKKLTATVFPLDAKDKTVTYTSSDKSVAKISKKGNITAKKAGTVTITAKAATGGVTSTCTVKVTPKKPTLTAKVYSGDSIMVSWPATSNISGYYVYRKIGNGSYKKIATVKGLNYYIDNGLSGVENYSYKIKAYTLVGKTKYKSSRSSAVKVYLPLAKASIKTATTSSGGNKLTWNQVLGATGYRVYRSTSKKGKYTRIKQIKKVTTLKYTDKKAKSKKRYYYKIRAYKVVNGKKVYGSYSSVVSIKKK